MFVFDRLYGRLNFPPIIMKLLDCPGLQRLRDIRMANIPFLSFPAFANSTRFEHSLGVCHLAQTLSKCINLPEKDSIELMLAALYHDVATPPFAHAVEEAMDRVFGFNHEVKLKELITGVNSESNIVSSGQKQQVFHGRALKLHRICQSPIGKELGLDLYRIADLAVGVENDQLGDMVCSDGIDLDNIDNVVRSASAMGIKCQTPELSEKLARSFCIYNNQIFLHESSKQLICEWQDTRNKLYNLIFSSVQDFAQQSMLKEAIKILSESSGFHEDDWALTDSQLLFNRINKSKKTRHILDRIQLGNPYNCIAIFIIEGNQATKQAKSNLDIIEKISTNDYLAHISTTVKSKPKSWNKIKVIANYYLDKTFRPINKKYYFMGRVTPHVEKCTRPRVILGLFSAHDRSIPFQQKQIIAEKLQKYCFQGSTIHIAKIEIKDSYPSIH